MIKKNLCFRWWLVMGAVFLARGAAGETIVVTSTAASGPGTLSQAIITANTNPGPNTIGFQISGVPPFTIVPTAALPAITAPVLIDATTQPGYSGRPVILIDGTNTSGATIGLRFSAGASTLRGVAISGFPIQAIELDSSSNTIQGNFVGTDVTGTVALGNGGDGILVKSSDNLIGGTNSGNGNVISGGNEIGIYVVSGQSNVIQGNLIGVPATGTNSVGNQDQGIVIYGGGGNLVGGSVSQARNVISGNGVLVTTEGSGIYVWNSSSDNVIQGNFIGTDISGGVAIGNQLGDGITIDSSAGNLISSNVLSGNGYCGVSIMGPGVGGTVVSGNFIGTDATGKIKLGNLYYGVELDDAAGCAIGGTSTGSGNLISGNIYDGIFTDGGGTNDLIQGNVIGLNAAGTGSLGNGTSGVELTDGTGITLGGTTAGARNVISGNGYYGVYLLGPGVSGISLEGNYIGTDPTGTLALGNFWGGICVQSSPSNQIGGTAVGARNLISGNSNGSGEGILLTNACWNVIQGNFIGTKIDGTNALPNFAHGIDLQVGSNSNLIGGTVSGAANRIAYAQADYSGVRVRTGSQNNMISGNAIFGNGPVGGLGICLGAYLGAFGVTANVDCQSGVPSGSANNLQNYPVITNVVTGATGSVVRGYLESAAGKTYQLQFFANPAVDPSGYGQGEVFLGVGTLTLGGSCTASFATVLPTSVPVGWVVSATAIDPTNNTSEFSADVAVTSPPALKIVPSKGGGSLLSYTNLSGPFTLQQTYSLVPPVNWVAVTSPLELTNGTYYVSNNSGQTNVFYRLTAP